MSRTQWTRQLPRKRCWASPRLCASTSRVRKWRLFKSHARGQILWETGNQLIIRHVTRSRSWRKTKGESCRQAPPLRGFARVHLFGIREVSMQYAGAASRLVRKSPFLRGNSTCHGAISVAVSHVFEDRFEHNVLTLGWVVSLSIFVAIVVLIKHLIHV